MKAICPNNPKHKRFITVAHVSQDWEVDEEGNFMDNLGDLEIVARPNPGNCWTCKDCHAEAIVTD
jgi:hypothetical protein